MNSPIPSRVSGRSTGAGAVLAASLSLVLFLPGTARGDNTNKETLPKKPASASDSAPNEHIPVLTVAEQNRYNEIVAGLKAAKGDEERLKVRSQEFAREFVANSDRRRAIAQALTTGGDGVTGRDEIQTEFIASICKMNPADPLAFVTEFEKNANMRRMNYYPGKALGQWAASRGLDRNTADILKKYGITGKITSIAWDDYSTEWFKSSQEDTITFIRELPKGKTRDVAIFDMLKSLRCVDGAASRNWAREIEDPALREQAIKLVDFLLNG